MMHFFEVTGGWLSNVVGGLIEGFCYLIILALIWCILSALLGLLIGSIITVGFIGYTRR